MYNFNSFQWDVQGYFKALRCEKVSHLSTGVEVFSMKLITFSFTLTDLDLRAKVILLTSDLTPVLFSSPCLTDRLHLNSKYTAVINAGSKKQNSCHYYKIHKMAVKHFCDFCLLKREDWWIDFRVIMVIKLLKQKIQQHADCAQKNKTENAQLCTLSLPLSHTLNSRLLSWGCCGILKCWLSNGHTRCLALPH